MLSLYAIQILMSRIQIAVDMKLYTQVLMHPKAFCKFLKQWLQCLFILSYIIKENEFVYDENCCQSL